MRGPTKTRLALVPDLDDSDGSTAQREPSEPRERRSSPENLPLSIRLTMEEVLDTAGDADLRADVLESAIGHIPTSPDITRKANRLHEVAVELRDIAEHIGDGMTDDRGSR